MRGSAPLSTVGSRGSIGEDILAYGRIGIDQPESKPNQRPTKWIIGKRQMYVYSSGMCIIVGIDVTCDFVCELQMLVTFTSDVSLAKTASISLSN